MSEKEFKVGDKIRMVRTIVVDYDQYVKGSVGVISRIEHTGDIFITMPEFYSGKDKTFFCLEYNFELVETTEPKTAFLTELSELLRKYDAKINFGFSVEERTCGVLFDIKDERIFYPFKVDEMDDTPDAIWRLPGCNYPLTADNVLNYDK